MSLEFDYALLKQRLGPLATRFDVEVLTECDSTNSLLLRRAAAGAPAGSVVLAERQSAGRGRRGRSWHSAPGCSLTFSVLWRLPAGVSPAGLSLAAGLAVAQALDGLGAREIALKWPNDVWYARRKLGGILVELSQQGARIAAVLGIGLNLRTDPAWANLDQPVAALDEALAPPAPAREVLLAALLTHLAAVLDRFAAGGFAALHADWSARHALQGAMVQVSSDRGQQRGRCLGVDHSGALLLHTETGVQALWGGDVSLRSL